MKQENEILNIQIKIQSLDGMRFSLFCSYVSKIANLFYLTKWSVISPNGVFSKFVCEFQCFMCNVSRGTVTVHVRICTN